MDSRKQLQAFEVAKNSALQSDCSSNELLTQVPFSLDLGEVQHIPNTSCYSISLLIRNLTRGLLNCALLISSPLSGVQDVREVGELGPGQAVRLCYEVNTLEDLLFEAVVRTPPVAFHRPNRTPIVTAVTLLEPDKALVRLQRLDKIFSTFLFRCKFTTEQVTVHFPAETDEVYQFFPLCPTKLVEGLHEEVWTVQAAESSWEVTIVYRVGER